MYKISVIMPIYNVEEFIEESIQSILNQTMDIKDIEILLIDDCSTDNSGKIAKRYAQNYENIKYYCLKENSGMAGKPRNVGIKMAQGNYVMFLDPDDLYITNACELMYNTIESQNVNFVTSNLRDIDQEGKDLNRIHIDVEQYNSQEINIDNIGQALKLLKHYCPSKIIKREFLINNNIRFLEGIPAEDAYFTSKMFLISKKSYYLNVPIVCYRRRTTGNVSETNNLNEKYFSRMIKANKEIYYLFQEFQEDRYYQYYYIDTMKYLIRQLILSKTLNAEQKAQIVLDMKELITYWQIAGLPTSSPKDCYNILSLFIEENKDTTINKIKNIEDKMCKDDINVIRKNEKRLVEYIEEFIE